MDAIRVMRPCALDAQPMPNPPLQAHNTRPDASYKLKLNQWADWHPEEWRSAMLPNLRLKPQVQQRPDGTDVLISEVSHATRW